MKPTHRSPGLKNKTISERHRLLSQSLYFSKIVAKWLDDMLVKCVSSKSIKIVGYSRE